MDFCRICLKKEKHKDIADLQDEIHGKSYVEIIMFCLNIMITPGTVNATGLCQECFYKLISYHNFKVQALQSDDILCSLLEDKSTLIGLDEVKCELPEESYSNSSFVTKDDIKDDPIHTQIKIELCDVDLDMCINVGTEDVNNDITLDNVNQEQKKRGRPKLLKTTQSVKNIIPKSVVCEKCGETVKHLRTHMKIHRPAPKPKEPPKPRSTKCVRCGRSVKNLAKHMKKHESDTGRRLYPCGYCERVFISPGGKSKHVRSVHLGKKKKCEVCDKSVSNLRNHMIYVHKESKTPFYKCNLCAYHTTSRSSLYVHTVAHVNSCPYECDNCGNKFKNKSLLISHIRSVHNKEKHHLCQYCSKQFFKRIQLQEHLRTHTNERPYKCEECKKQFKTSTMLKKHRLIHIGVKNFHCQLCDMSFLCNGSLTVHMISHTKEKRHKCQFCGVLFGRSDHRRRHERTAHLKHLIGSEHQQ